MRRKMICSFVSRYSEIEGLQKRRTVTYAAEATANGVCLLLRQENDFGIRTEACVCPSVSSETAASVLQYIFENSIGVGCWYDVLRDLSIPYTVAMLPAPVA